MSDSNDEREIDQAKVATGSGMLVCDRCLEPYGQYLTRNGTVGDLCSVCGTGHLYPVADYEECNGGANCPDHVHLNGEPLWFRKKPMRVVEDVVRPVHFIREPMVAACGLYETCELTANPNDVTCNNCLAAMPFSDSPSSEEVVEAFSDLAGAFETGELDESEEAAHPDLRERPIDTFITAYRQTKVVLRALKRRFSDLKTVRVQCVDCRLMCIIASSSADERERLESEGHVVEVICFDCCIRNGISLDNAGMTEAQAKQMTEILMRRVVSRENAN